VAEDAAKENIEGSAFDPAHFGPVVIIQLNRIYDALMALLAATGSPMASHLHDLHAAGQFLSPPPSYAEVTGE
jgi:hypothetical protein